ncbi:MAG: hypothetical protein IJ688_00030 [Treponema sp.]|nr:hypothetical protein [Treponema sp.]
MKKILVTLTALVAFSLFFACKNPAGSVEDVNENGSSTENPSGSNGSGGSTTIVTTAGIKFNFTGANAVAKLESSGSGARAAVDVDSLGDLVKILADGSMEDAITVEEGASLAKIVAIYKSPVEGSEDFFVVFEGTSVISREDVAIEHKDEWSTPTEYQTKETKIGQLICVHSDGTIADILKKDVEENTNEKDYYYDYDAKNYLSLRTDTVTFDASGNVYFIVNDSYWEYSNNESNYVDNGQCIYQFNPKTNELTQMVAAVAGTTYDRMQIDNDSQWIFASGYRNGASFLRAIPVSNPNSPVNIYYASNSYSFESNKWAYDDASGVMYYLAKDGNNYGLHIATKNAGFKDKKYVKRYTFETETVTDKEKTEDSTPESEYINYELSDMFDYISVDYSDFYWYSSLLENKKFSVEKLMDSFLVNAGNVRLSLDDVDIKFDAYENESGSLKLLYLITKGLKNEDALNALNSYYGKVALYYRDCANNNYFAWKNKGRGYDHNFYSDILYVKGTDTLVRDYDEVIVSYCSNSDYVYSEEEGWHYEDIYTDLKGSDYFERYDDGTYYSSGYASFVETGAFDTKYIALNLKKTPEEILQYLFSICNVNDEKEFRLTSFKDDADYSALYTTLTDEEAIKWIAEDMERLSLFCKLMSESEGEYRYKYNSDGSTTCNYVSGPFSFISKTCFVKDTDSSALVKDLTSGGDTTVSPVIDGQYSIPYCYSGSEWISFSEGTEYYSGYGSGSLSVTKDGVFYDFTNLYDSWWSSENSKPFYFIVKLSYNDGTVEETVTKISLPAGKVVNSQKVGTRMFMQYSLMSDTGSELGYHHIYSVDLSTGVVTNHFDEVANRNSLEVITYSVADRNLYFSAVRGTTVENQIVDIITNVCNPLATKRKMVAVYAF